MWRIVVACSRQSWLSIGTRAPIRFELLQSLRTIDTRAGCAGLGGGVCLI
jgi:hypothetical protein